jgi:hypothetical protein
MYFFPDWFIGHANWVSWIFLKIKLYKFFKVGSGFFWINFIRGLLLESLGNLENCERNFQALVNLRKI